MGQALKKPAAKSPWTDDQTVALQFLQGPARHSMLYGGSRSGKTFVLLAAIVHRAVKAPGSRHVVFRHRFNHRS